MKRMYVWATLLLSFGLCGFPLASCGDDDDDVLTDVTAPDNGNDNKGDGKEEGNGNKTDLNGHEAVDLGLSVKWATCNVGANSPEEYGGYYAWGEIEEKDIYDYSNYKYCNYSEKSITKYCTHSSDGTADNKILLDSEDDAAHVKWGGSWRIPTYSEFSELLNENCCSWTWTTQNNVNGYVVLSKINGNSIFLPAAGYRSEGDIDREGTYGSYWSASLYETYSDDFAHVLSFSISLLHTRKRDRSYGFSVRPVTN